MTVVENLAGLYELATPKDGDMLYVKGFWDKNDGGGGFFIFDKFCTVNPFFDDTSYYKVGYNANYDGMVCKAENVADGRWIRQWDRGALNLRWFGALPDFSPSRDASFALNASLAYAQFNVQSPKIANPNKGRANEPTTIPNPEITIFNYQVYTRPGKTIYIPAGRYKFFSAINSIQYGVVIEGEGNMGASSHGTRLLIFHEYTEVDEALTGVKRDEYGFLRYYANAANNSGGGLKNLSISVENIHTNAKKDLNNGYDTNVIVLIAPDKTPSAGLTYCPAVSKWKAENVFIVMRARAKRAIYMRSYQEGGQLPWRIRDIVLMNCKFAGGTLEGETIRAMNCLGLHIIGGTLSSGLGVHNKAIYPGIVLGGIYGCANTHLNGVDLTHASIKIEKKSLFTNIDCSFGKLLIYNGSDKDHEGLQVTKKFILNKRKNHPIELQCPINIDNNTVTFYKCYNNAHEIENDTDADWMHNQDYPNTTV
ncbi:hypothetical protein IMCC3317_28440 [Kordia antarctica]|uniref:Pectate lyase superfamily protein domain-containing protein n=1 Tax=Kordia antarctica TaxID=1218801 RepID=A0A7L4ZLL8_9FLAO|nr:hypothetical protein [Kordia antarctica]QHI37465.1 hypothetical protein IMCC3317_28440 [Kordia antarctica]